MTDVNRCRLFDNHNGSSVAKKKKKKIPPSHLNALRVLTFLLISVNTPLQILHLRWPGFSSVSSNLSNHQLAADTLTEGGR